MGRSIGTFAANATFTAPNGAPVTLIRSKYEDLVSDFASWIDTLLAHLTPSYAPATLKRVREELIERLSKSFTPDGRHRRSVSPGRSNAELSAQTIEALRSGAWSQLGYS